MGLLLPPSHTTHLQVHFLSVHIEHRYLIVVIIIYSTKFLKYVIIMATTFFYDGVHFSSGKVHLEFSSFVLLHVIIM